VFLALDQGLVGKVLTIQLEQVEGVELEWRSGGNAGLQHREVRTALAIDGNDLAVDQGRACGQRLQRRQDHLELTGPVMAVARVNHDFATRNSDLGAIAVELHLKEPIGAYRDVVR